MVIKLSSVIFFNLVQQKFSSQWLSWTRNGREMTSPLRPLPRRLLDHKKSSNSPHIATVMFTYYHTAFYNASCAIKMNLTTTQCENFELFKSSKHCVFFSSKKAPHSPRHTHWSTKVWILVLSFTLSRIEMCPAPLWGQKKDIPMPRPALE